MTITIEWTTLFAIYVGMGFLTLVFNVGTLIGSGGFITSPLIIVRNALLWPVFLPLLIADWWLNA